jgi:hypothetical protein
MNILRSLTVIGPATDSSSGLRVRLTKVPGYVCPPWANSGQRTLVIAHCNRNWFPHQRNQDTLAGIRTAPALTRRTAVMNGLPPPPPFQPPFPPQGFPPPQGPPPGPPPGLPPGPPPGPRNWFGTGPKIAVAVIAIGVAVGALWAGLTFNSAGGQNQTTQSPATAQNAHDNDKNNQQNNEKKNHHDNQQNNDKNNQQNNDKNNHHDNHDLPPGATTSGGDHRWRDHGERDHG